jgi:hypothetical protein
MLVLSAAPSPTTVQTVIEALPPILTAATTITAKAAAVAPQAVPIINQLLRLLPLGPAIAPLVMQISRDAAAILQAAPSYAPILRQVADVLARAPTLAPQIAAITGPMADFARRVGEDPSLGIFVARLVTIIDLASSKSDKASAEVHATTVGVGLDRVVPWLDRGIFVMRHPWVLAVVPAAILAAAGGVGYALGRRRR